MKMNIIPDMRINDPKYKNYLNNYKKTLQASDYVVTLSKEVGKQIKRLWNIESQTMFSYFRNEEIEQTPKQET